MQKPPVEAERSANYALDADAGNLTQAQRYFAQVLGRLLADELSSDVTLLPPLSSKHGKTAVANLTEDGMRVPQPISRAMSRSSFSETSTDSE